MRISPKGSLAVACLLLRGALLSAQIVTDMSDESDNPVITTTDQNSLTGDEYGADGIINEWEKTLKDFNSYDDQEGLEEKITKKKRNGKTVTAKNGLRLPQFKDENGIDLFLLTEEGINIYMAMDAPVYMQEITPEIMRWIRYYAYHKRQRTERIFKRYQGWAPVMKKCFKMYGIPEEMTEICLVESGCTYEAVSPAGAVGMWQIMPATARHYGLTVNAYTDERKDPALSLHAAAKILGDCYLRTGDWTLAAAAYNCGSGNVLRHMKDGRNTWQDICRFLPEETRHYVPSIIAIHYVWTYRKQLGF